MCSVSGGNEQVQVGVYRLQSMGFGIGNGLVHEDQMVEALSNISRETWERVESSGCRGSGVGRHMIAVEIRKMNGPEPCKQRLRVSTTCEQQIRPGPERLASYK